MNSVGRICVKTAGRDAGKYCVIVEQIDKDYVLIDGQTRRRRCNIDHLEPTEKTVKLKKNADNKTVVAVLKKEGIEVVVKKASKKKPKERPRKQKRESKPKETPKEDKIPKEAKKSKTAEKTPDKKEDKKSTKPNS